MNITQRASSVHGIAPGAISTLLSAGLVGLLCLAGCAAQVGEASVDDSESVTPAGDSAQGDIGTRRHELSTGHTAGGANGATTQGTTGIPATPDPNEPQPSPWSPMGPASLTPASAPQPSPWQGHKPGPGGPDGPSGPEGPNTVPAGLT